MAPSVEQLQYTTQLFNIVVGFIVWIPGLIGNVIAIVVLNKIKRSRGNPGSLYLNALLVVDTLHLFHGLLSRILANGLKIDPTPYSLFYCKLRPVLVTSLPLISYTLGCMATIDQFFSTSREVRMRQRSSRKVAIWSIVIAIIVWFLHGVPYSVIYTIRSSTPPVCAMFNFILDQYSAWVVLCLWSFIIPVPVMGTFDYLTYKNLKRLTTGITQQQHRTERIDRQFTLMLLLQMIVIVISIMPLGILNVYFRITSTVTKSAERVAIEQLLYAILFVIYYINFGSSFYVFYASSSTFRKQVKTVVLHVHPSQINPQSTAVELKNVTIPQIETIG